VTAFVNHPQISGILDEEEEEALHYLTKVEVEEFDDIKSGYRIKLHFDDNPFFTNDLLVKEFFLGSAEPTSTSTDINWRENMNLNKRDVASEGGAKPGKKRPLDQPRTFFGWFVDNTDASADDIAEVIKDDMWPNPLQYFLVPDVEVGDNGVADDDLDSDEDGEGAGGDDFEEEDDDEGDEADDNENDENA